VTAAGPGFTRVSCAGVLGAGGWAAVTSVVGGGGGGTAVSGVRGGGGGAMDAAGSGPDSARDPTIPARISKPTTPPMTTPPTPLSPDFFRGMRAVSSFREPRSGERARADWGTAGAGAWTTGSGRALFVFRGLLCGGLLGAGWDRAGFSWGCSATLGWAVTGAPCIRSVCRTAAAAAGGGAGAASAEASTSAVVSAPSVPSPWGTGGAASMLGATSPGLDSCSISAELSPPNGMGAWLVSSERPGSNCHEGTNAAAKRSASSGASPIPPPLAAAGSSFDGSPSVESDILERA